MNKQDKKINPKLVQAFSLMNRDARIYANQIAQPNYRDTGIALLLWVFSGTIGGHDIYLNRTTDAVIKICMFVLVAVGFFVPGDISLVFHLVSVPYGLILIRDFYYMPRFVEKVNEDLLLEALNILKLPAPK